MEINNTISLQKSIEDESNAEYLRNLELAEISELLNITREIYARSKALSVLEEDLQSLTEIITTERAALNDLVARRKILEKVKVVETLYVYPNYPKNPVFQMPTSPDIGPPYNPHVVPSSWKNNCPVCGIDWSGPMGYCCNNKDCPTPRSTCTTTL